MYKIGSFNCLNLSLNSTKNFSKLADIIILEQFDIVALQEVKGQNALNVLLKYLPNYWTGLADNSSVNDYAYIWNSRRFELANYQDDKVSRVYYPRIYKQYKIDKKAGQFELKREPFYARFFPIGGGAPFIEIRLLNAHLRFSRGVDGKDSQLGIVDMRKNEMDILIKSIYNKISDKRYGNNRVAYTILLGDYNLNLPITRKSPYLLESYTIVDGNNTKVIATVQSDFSTLSKAGNESDKEQIYANNYDHFTYDINKFENMVISANRINALEKYYDYNKEEYINEISDHIPILMELELRGK